MSNEITTREPAEVALSQEQSILAVIARAAQDSTVDVDKMERLLQMQKDIMRMSAEQAFKAALARIQAKMPRVEKDGKIIVKGQVRSTYAKIENVDKYLRPLLAEEGFSVRFSTSESGSKTLLITMTVSHNGGHSESSTAPMPIDSSEFRSGDQNYRSTQSFGKRACICDFFNIITVDEDDDGGGGGGYITNDQADNIRALLSEVGANTPGFLKYVGAESIEKIPARDYSKSVAAIEAKRR
jgi:hypothetical protein